MREAYISIAPWGQTSPSTSDVLHEVLHDVGDFGKILSSDVFDYVKMKFHFDFIMK